MDCESRRGAFYHPMVAFDADGVALGIVGAKSWTRQQIRKASKADYQARGMKLTSMAFVIKAVALALRNNG